MNKKVDKENLVIKKYKRIERVNTIITVLSVTLVPLVAIFFNIAMKSTDYRMRSIAQVVGVSTIVMLFVFYVIGRRCPNCHRRLNKYVILPRACPYCKVKFKK